MRCKCKNSFLRSGWRSQKACGDRQVRIGLTCRNSGPILYSLRWFGGYTLYLGNRNTVVKGTLASLITSLPTVFSQTRLTVKGSPNWKDSCWKEIRYQCNKMQASTLNLCRKPELNCRFSMAAKHLESS